ncbi:uncharacterized protein NPIL_100481 [Nephila pilipes]|uniref:Uncharacterized protein n=1 Tax=Nephila pilipes TaxID=299642 RepID=A0A8X6MAM1_NEPPI|nr:uncharacterized protein NPIL_100481 [Nephila pilipes]
MNSSLQISLSIVVIFNLFCVASLILAVTDSGEFHPSLAYNVMILSDDQRTLIHTFVNTFVQAVYDSDALKDVFNISETPAPQFTHFVYSHFIDLLKSVGATDQQTIADFGTRSMAQNFDVFKLDEMLRVYSNTVSSYALSEGALTQDNAKDLAKRYVEIMEKQAKKNVVKGDPTSKYHAIGDGILAFFKSVSTVTVDKVWKIAIY